MMLTQKGINRIKQLKKKGKLSLSKREKTELKQLENQLNKQITKK